MISNAVAFKLFAAAIALGNVVIATAVLPTSEAVAFLSAVSFAQLFQPMAGFGLVTRLVAIKDENTILATRHRSYFALYGLAVGVLAIAVSLAQGARIEIVLFAAALAAHAVESERVRAGFGSHAGIYVQNLTVFLGSLTVLVLGEFTFLPAALMFAALLGYQAFVPERQFDGELLHAMKPNMKDVVKGVRAMSVTQFYSAIVVVSALLLPAAEALLVTLVYRSGLFFNWQLFYWMRFGHKDALDINSPENRATNNRLSRLSLVSFAGAAVGTLAVNFISPLADLLDRFDGTDIRRLAILITAYGGFQFLLSRTFPFEATIVYRTESRPDWAYLGLCGLALGATAVGAVSTQSAVVLLIIVEVCRVAFRVLSRRQFSDLPGAHERAIA